MELQSNCIHASTNGDRGQERALCVKDCGISDLVVNMMQPTEAEFVAPRFRISNIVDGFQDCFHPASAFTKRISYSRITASLPFRLPTTEPQKTSVVVLECECHEQNGAWYHMRALGMAMLCMKPSPFPFLFTPLSLAAKSPVYARGFL